MIIVFFCNFDSWYRTGTSLKYRKSSVQCFWFRYVYYCLFGREFFMNSFICRLSDSTVHDKLGLNPGLLQGLLWQSDATRHHSARCHPLSARSHRINLQRIQIEVPNPFLLLNRIEISDPDPDNDFPWPNDEKFQINKSKKSKYRYLQYRVLLHIYFELNTKAFQASSVHFWGH